MHDGVVPPELLGSAYTDTGSDRVHHKVAVQQSSVSGGVGLRREKFSKTGRDEKDFLRDPIPANVAIDLGCWARPVPFPAFDPRSRSESV